jgi:CHASE2 domain-containing sensor protein
MRRLSYRDGFAALLLAAVAIPYVGYLVRGEMPFIQDPVGMAAVGITGLVLSYLAWGIETHSTFGKVMLVAGLAALGIGIAAALVGVEGSELLLAIFMGAYAVIFVAETAYRAVSGQPEPQTA